MSEAEVIRLIGRKWDSEGGGASLINGDDVTHEYYVSWHGLGGDIEVKFGGRIDEEPRVYDATFVPANLSWWERLLKRIGW
jgi:hypothetical protein